jgi:D-alanine-D-alanine ligase
MKVCLVYNRDSKRVINLFGQPNRERIGLQQIKRITDALKQGGHRAIALEGDKDLIDRLEEFMPRVVAGEQPGIVLNLSYGVQGQARYTHVPSILEMVGVPYVGSGPVAHSIALDKVITKMVLVQHGLPTPEFAILQEPEFEAPKLDYPLIVKPKHEAVSFGVRVANDEAELREAAGAIFAMFGQAVLAERAIEEPLRWIAGNAGIDGSIVVQKVKEGRGVFGFNARSEEYEDLVAAGVIDPTKVVRTALQNAASVASLLLTTEALVAEQPEKKKGGAAGMPDMGDMGM